MLAWVMNLGFAASNGATPPPSSPQQGYLTISVGTFIRTLLVISILGLTR